MCSMYVCICIQDISPTIYCALCLTLLLCSISFSHGDVVWAKVEPTSPYWPALVIDPSHLPATNPPP
ncbi:hypothetical protein EON65_20110, partial [archaeon]